MKDINFKKYNFSTIFKNINFRRYKFLTLYKYINFKRYKFSTIFKSINFKRYKFSTIFKNINFKRYNFSTIFKNINFKRYNFSTIFKNIKFKRYKFLPIYIAGLIVFTVFIYLSIPMFFNYDKLKIENTICKDLDIKCSIQGEIKYSFLPSPRIKFKDFIIKEFTGRGNILGKVENVTIKLSPYNLSSKKKFIFTKIELKNAEINFDFEKLNEYKNFSKKEINLKLLNLRKGKINFFEGKKYIATIKDVNFKYNSNKNINEGILKGEFLGDKIRVNLQNKKSAENPSKIFILKFFDLNLFVKATIFNSESNQNTISGNLFFKKDKNRLTAVFDYKDDQIIFKKGNLRNNFLDGKFSGRVTLLPYFNFYLDIDLDNVYFTRLYKFLVELDKTNRKNLFRVSNKINGQLNLSTDKIYSKYSFIHSFETRVKFVNGDISIEQLLLNLGKLGAADITGLIKKDTKFTNFNFEKNIYIDNQRYFYNKFGIYNKQNIPSNLFISGNFDLVNMNLRLDEISNNEKIKDEDVVYIEREFNDFLLEDGYASLFDYLRLKEFIRSIMNETN